MIKKFINVLVFILFVSLVYFLLTKNPYFFKSINEITENIKPKINQLITSELKVGSTGNDVKIVQIALGLDKTIYPSGIVSSYYGVLTKQAVENFQKKYGLAVNGSMDRLTVDKFNDIYGIKTREYYLDLVPTPELVQLNFNNNSIIPNLEEWGKAKQISEHSWTMNIGYDAKMATPGEIFEALNNYRIKHGRNSLNWDDRLANYASQRAQYFTSIDNLDEHAGFNEFLKSEDNVRSLGYYWLGENSSFGYRLEGVHLIEWIYAGDQPHNDNQLNPDWTHVGIGVDGYQTDLIFAAQPI
ncbi:peptidoglycan-binding protein [Candidatus Roizmanbacteria bacterium]|nr:peptidoglycan-binding protein [Candidatus Roizmanbacteria bacterium]